jgi:hypothetical protein
MFDSQPHTRGQRLRLLILPLIAALTWTTVAAEPAFARHLRSRAFSIVDDKNPLADDAPDTFTCTAANETSDYVCQNTAKNFSRPLTTQVEGPVGLLAANYDTDEKTKLFSPTSFDCHYTGKPGQARLAGKFSCKGGGQKFTLRDIAYVNPKVDSTVNREVIYGLPCAPCHRKKK